MTWVIDNQNLQNRTWVCTACNALCNSKNPWSRTVFQLRPAPRSEDKTDGLDDEMYLRHLNLVSTVRMEKAYPPRPRESVFADGYVSEEGFCLLHREKDVCIYVDPGNSDVRKTGEPLQTPADALMRFLKAVREADEGVLRVYACEQFDGHRWTDDPELVSAAFRGGRKRDE